MTKEELIKISRENLRKSKQGSLCECYDEAFIKGYELSKKRILELEQQIEKMKCCENCKYNSYWGNELHCNYGLKEALQEDKLVECKNMDKWEIREK